MMLLFIYTTWFGAATAYCLRVLWPDEPEKLVLASAQGQRLGLEYACVCGGVDLGVGNLANCGGGRGICLPQNLTYFSWV